MDEELEIVEIPEDMEEMGKALTLLIYNINPKINLGQTYEILIYLLLQMENEPVDELTVAVYSSRILDTIGAVPEEKH